MLSFLIANISSRLKQTKKLVYFLDLKNNKYISIRSKNNN